MKLSLATRSFISSLFMVGLIVVLQACGGGGGSSTPPVTPDAKPTGYYTGSAAVKESNNTTDLSITDIQILINDGRLMIMSDAQAVLYDGTMSITGNSFTSTVDVYKNGAKQAGAAGTATISGSITEGSQITGTFTGTGLGNGTFVSTYSSLNNTASTSASIDNSLATGRNKNWLCSLNLETSILALDIANTGSFVTGGVPSTGVFRRCEVDGTVLPITSTGLFAVNVSTIAGQNTCDNADVESGTSGTYSGLAILKPGAAPAQDKLTFTISNGKYSTGDDCVL